MLVGEAGHADKGDCQACPAEILGNGSLPDMLRLAERLGADVTSQPVQTARITMFRMPACRIVAAGRDIPSDDPGLARLLADVPDATA